MKQTLLFKNRVAVRARASIVGKKEGAGPLGGRFDVVLDDDLLGQKSWELAESEMLRRAAKADLPVRIGRIAAETGLRYAKLSIRASRTKWGSCSGRNHISLSLFLMTLPEHLRDYVIVHELCHTVHHDHSPRFHALVDRLVGGREKALSRELRAYAIR